MSRLRLVVSCDFQSSKQLFEELIQSNRFAFTKWIPLYRKDYKYSPVDTDMKRRSGIEIKKKALRPAYSFLVSLSC